MHLSRVAMVAVFVMSGAGVAALQQPATQQPPATTQQPAQPATPPAAVAVPPIPATPVGPLASRTFTGGCGLWLHPVRPERVAEFEQFLAYVRDALAKTSNVRVQEQARGWKFFKATELGPNGVALYVFDIDPAVAGAEYALGPILSEIYPDAAQLTEIWNLYTTSVTSGGTILNLAPVPLQPPQPILAPPLTPEPPLTPGQKPVVPGQTAAPGAAAGAPATAPATGQIAPAPGQ